MAMNCVIVDDDSLSVRLLEGLIAQTESLVHTRSFSSAVEAVKKVEDKFNQDQAVQFKGDYVFVKSDTALVKVDIRQLMWVEALADYVALVTKEKKYVCHSTMKSIESKLPADQFVRVHRSYIVRIDQIDAIEDKTVSVGKKIIPVGGTYRDSLMNRLNLI